MQSKKFQKNCSIQLNPHPTPVGAQINYNQNYPMFTSILSFSMSFVARYNQPIIHNLSKHLKAQSQKLK